MRLCQYHRDALRTALAKHGLDVRNSVGPTNPLFQAEALILANAVAHSPAFAIKEAHDHCPICTFVTPSWIDKTAQSIYQAREEERHNTRQ